MDQHIMSDENAKHSGNPEADFPEQRETKVIGASIARGSFILTAGIIFQPSSKRCSACIILVSCHPC